nr:MAG TPA: Protein of unknown function (DUF3080) [Caudoviricetes sp.]
MMNLLVFRKFYITRLKPYLNRSPEKFSPSHHLNNIYL